MTNTDGYISSQTWDAWINSAKVLWDNTEVFYIFSIIISVGAVFFTYYNFPILHKKFGDQNENLKEEQEDKKLSCETQENVNGNNDFLKPDVPKYMKGTQQLVMNIEAQMSVEEKMTESCVRTQQLAKIHDLMMNQQEKFEETSIEEIRNQMKFYCG